MADQQINQDILLTVKADTSEAGAGIDQIKDKLQDVSNTNLDKPFKSFKAEIKEATNDAKRLGEQYGQNSKQFITAAQRVADLKDEYKKFNATTAAFNPDNKLQALVSVAKGATGAIEGVTGAMNFLGVQSEKNEEAIRKLQGLMAFSESLNSIEDITKGIENFGKATGITTVLQKASAAATTVAAFAMKSLGIASETTSVGFKVLRGAIIATGIGALVVGLVALIENFGAVKKAVLNLIPGLSSIASFIGGIINSITDFIGVTSEAERATNKMIEANEKQIKKTEEFLDSQGDKFDKYTQAKIKANNEYLKHFNEISKDEEKTEEEKQELIKQYRLKANREIIGADKERSEKAAEDAKKAAEEEKKKQEELKRIRKEADDKEKARQDNIAAQDKVTSKLILDARIAAIKDETTKKQIELTVQKQEEIDSSLDALNKKLINQDIYNVRRQAIDDKYASLETQLLIDRAKADEEARQKAIEEVKQKAIDRATDASTFAEANVTKTVRENKIVTSENKTDGESIDTPESAASKITAIAEAKRNAENLAFQLDLLQADGNKSQIEAATQNHENKLSEIAEEATATRLAIRTKEKEGQVALMGSILAATSAVGDAIGKQTVAGKAIAVAGALVSTYLAIAKANSLGYPASIPAMIIAAATGFAAVKNILSTQVPGQASSGGSVPAAPTASLAPVATAPQNIQDVRVTNNQQVNQQPVRAYISDKDLQSNEQRRNFLNNVSSF